MRGSPARTVRIALPSIAVCIGIFGLFSYSAGHAEWTAITHHAEMASLTALGFVLLGTSELLCLFIPPPAVGQSVEMSARCAEDTILRLRLTALDEKLEPRKCPLTE